MSRCFFLCVFYVMLACSCKEQQQKAEMPANAATAEEKQFSLFLDSLDNIKATDLEKINSIRKYLAARVDYGHSHDSLTENYYKVPWDQLSAFECLRSFKADSLSATCGLTSYILSKLYNHAGYRNFVYSCGYANTGISHEFNLVKSGDKMIVQDALFNLTITNADGSPKDFIQTLNELKSNDTSNISIDSQEKISELWVDSLNKDFFFHFCSNNAYEEHIQDISIENNRVKISLKNDYPSLTGWMVEKGRDKLKADGLREDFLSLYLKPLYLKDGHSGTSNDSLMQIITSVTNSGSQD